MLKSRIAGIAAGIALALVAGSATAADLGGKTIKIGSDTTSPPMESIDPASGQIVGFDIDMVNAICERINGKAEFVTTGWDGIFAALAGGQFDMVVSGVSITPERDKTMDFSEPYLINGKSILIRAEDDGMTVDDLKKGKKLATQTGTTNADLAAELVGRENVSLYDSFAASVVALQNGDVAGVVIESANGDAYNQEFAGKLVVGITGLQSDPLGMVFREGDPMVAAFNDGLKQIEADGTLAKLKAQYWTAQ
jgi:polar amino acid transport system substrate-binding protein